eukprot:10301276-Alexandrium_andersonii.AAC.1
MEQALEQGCLSVKAVPFASSMSYPWLGLENERVPARVRAPLVGHVYGLKCLRCVAKVFVVGKPVPSGTAWPHAKCGVCLAQFRTGRAECWGCGVQVRFCRCTPPFDQPSARQQSVLDLLRNAPRASGAVGETTTQEFSNSTSEVQSGRSQRQEAARSSNDEIAPPAPVV